MFGNKKGIETVKEKCVCEGKIYRYVGFKMDLEICYQCGKYNVKTDVPNDDFIGFINENPELIPHLIELNYLIPA